ncbi:hypothetical protein BsWGS_11984 [Bradybaena similaris]
MPAQLGYWAIRGLVQPIRLLLNYVGEDFEDVLYNLGKGPEFSREEWLSVKFTLGLDFPNLPYYIDDDVKLTQSNAILRYLARKHNLYGETEKEQAHIDLLLDEITDLRQGFSRLCYGADFDDKKIENYVEETKPKLAQLEKYLADKQYFIGDKVTVCDFNIYDILDAFKVLEPKLLADSPKLEEYHERFEELPAIKAYINSEKFISRPINNTCAKWF